MSAEIIIFPTRSTKFLENGLRIAAEQVAAETLHERYDAEHPPLLRRLADNHKLFNAWCADRGV